MLQTRNAKQQNTGKIKRTYLNLTLIDLIRPIAEPGSSGNSLCASENSKPVNDTSGSSGVSERETEEEIL